MLTRGAGAAAAAGGASRLRPGSLVQDRFRIQEFIAQGGMAEVYAAEQLGTGRQVALKLVAPERRADPVASRRLLREAIALRRAKNPGIVELYEVGEHEGAPYLVLERMQGRTLRGLLAARGRFPAREVLSIGLRLAETLAHCHVTGVIHRDVKPDNVFFVQGGGVKLYDFGTARVPEEYESDVTRSITQDGSVVGTPEYMAPEALRAMPDLDTRVDVYGVGVLMYELLTGSVPFEGTLPKVLLAQSGGPAPTVASKRHDVPAVFGHVVDRCLELDPGARYASMAELSVELEAAREFPAVSIDPKRTRSSVQLTAAGSAVARPGAPASPAAAPKSQLKPDPGPPSSAASPMAKGVEARRFPRAPYTTPAMFSATRGDSLNGRIEEISEGGTQFITSLRIEPGRAGTLRFSAPMSGKMCQVNVTARWSRAGRGNLHAVGFEFLDLTADARAAIAKYVALMGGT
jgi:serine/threonine protein kinase